FTSPPFFFPATPPSALSTLPLPAALPISGAHYHVRPSLWVEPRGEWGKGAIQLMEIPTENETHDNIVAYWLPERQPEPGEELSRSEEHTSELQSRENLVCRLLLEKKKQQE